MALPLPGGPDPDPVRQAKFEALAAASGGLGGRNIERRSGNSSVAFSASDSSGVVTVNHGLGRTPASVVATSNTGSGVIMSAVNWTTTTFQVQGRYPFGALTATIAFSWIAEG